MKVVDAQIQQSGEALKLELEKLGSSVDHNDDRFSSELRLCEERLLENITKSKVKSLQANSA
jgi:hypothetical protein